MPRSLEHPAQGVAAASLAYQRSHFGVVAPDGSYMKGQVVAPARPGTVTGQRAATVVRASDPNAGYQYSIPTADECRNNPQSASRYGWRPNHYAYCEVFIYHWTYFNPLIAATGQDRVTLIGQGSFGGDPARNGGDGRVVTFTLSVDQVQVNSGTLPAGATLTFGITCNGDPAGSCQTTSPPVTMPDQQWNNNSATFTFTSPDGVGFNGGGKVGTAWNWAAFAYGSFFWTVFPNCAGCANNSSTNGPTGSLRFDGPGSAGMPSNHQTGATFQPVDANDNRLVDTMSLGYNGVYANTSYAIAAHHYYVALNFPNSTYPLTGNKSIPAEFTRLVGSLGRILSGQVAIPLCQTVWGDDYATRYGLGTDSRPLQCDEFPFAATYQGNPVRNGLPDGAHMSVCPLNGPDNGSAGNALAAFYRQQRIFDGNGASDTDPHDTDWYSIQFTGVPSPPPTAAQALPCPVPDPAAPGVGRLVINVPNGGQFRTVWDNGSDQAGPLGDVTANWTAIAGGQQQTFASGDIYWSAADGTHEIDGTIFQKYQSLGETTGSLGFPTSDAFAISGGTQQNFQHGIITDISGTVQANSWITGRAAHAGNDYPYETVGQFGNHDGTDAWNEYYGQCDSFAAWKVYENLAGTPQLPDVPVPAVGWQPANSNISPVNQFTWGPNGGIGNADYWKQAWAARGNVADNVPAPGAIAWWPNASNDPQDGLPGVGSAGLGSFGHLGYVTDVYPDGSITIEMYNMRDNGQYSVVHMAYNAGYTDSSFGQAAMAVHWPGGFIHISDGPSGAASPPEPAAGVVQAGYASQVKVIGPGSSSSEFATGNVPNGTWFSQPGTGEIGTTLWTHVNGSAAVSTATWSPAGLSAGTCYRVDALVPNNHSDNPTAIYNITSAGGTSVDAVNENVQTNDWSELGVFETSSSGGLSVRLDDRGNTGLYVAADAVRFWRQTSCPAAAADASPVLAPAADPFRNAWSTKTGSGFFGSMLYTLTSNASATGNAGAFWTPSHLVPFGCYDISVYVPDNRSDNPDTIYSSADAYYGTFSEQVNENNFTNQFAPIGTFQARSDGSLPLNVFNPGAAGLYVAADAAAFVLNPNCQAENGAVNPFGSVPSSSNLGPGSLPGQFTTTGTWNYMLGHGYANHELWTTDGSGATARWTFHGNPNTRYCLDAYIPNSHANNTTVNYDIATTTSGGQASIDQATTTGWTGLGSLTTAGDGLITVTLAVSGPADGAFTAADEVSVTAC